MQSAGQQRLTGIFKGCMTSDSYSDRWKFAPFGQKERIRNQEKLYEQTPDKHIQRESCCGNFDMVFLSDGCSGTFYTQGAAESYTWRMINDMA